MALQMVGWQEAGGGAIAMSFEVVMVELEAVVRASRFRHQNPVT
jgi:hypothetical protein